MDKAKKILSDIVGQEGFEILQKAVFKRGTQAVIDPLEYYFPLIVAPRSIISWLVQNIKPLKVHEHKEFSFPGRDDIKIYAEKQDIDQYRAEFRQGGKIIHSFEKQSLPAMSAHLMTVGEMYESFSDSAPEIKNQPKKEKDSEQSNNSEEVVRSIMLMNDIKPKEDSEHLKWVVSHANVKELTGVIGKLVDALVAKKASNEKEDLGKMSIKEHKNDAHEIKESISPEEKDKKDRKTAGKPSNVLKDYEQETKDHRQLGEETLRDKITFKPPKIEEVKSGKTAAKGNIKKEELLSKPYASKAQRRYFHAAAARGEIPKKTVEHWDKASKGKNLPEKSNKKQEMAQAPSPGPAAPNVGPSPKTELPAGIKHFNRSVLKKLTAKSEEKIEKKQIGPQAPGGAGMPQGPKQPQPPKPPVPASNAPAAAAAKQAQASAQGKMAKPPGAARAPGSTIQGPKAPKAAKPMAPSPLKMSEKIYVLTESEVYTPCQECGKSEFVKGEDGNPNFSPCACFSVMRKDESGKPFKFVSVLKKNNGSFEMNFSPSADPDSVKAFLLTLKASLLVKRRFGNIS
jgi:hypothetical protein